MIFQSGSIVSTFIFLVTTFFKTDDSHCVEMHFLFPFGNVFWQSTWKQLPNKLTKIFQWFITSCKCYGFRFYIWDIKGLIQMCWDIPSPHSSLLVPTHPSFLLPSISFSFLPPSLFPSIFLFSQLLSSLLLLPSPSSLLLPSLSVCLSSSLPPSLSFYVSPLSLHCEPGIEVSDC